MKTVIKLNPNDSHKSFYGKAHVEQENGVYTLFSYGTPVIRYESATDTIKRLWFGYSATTMRHVNAFMAFLCKPLGGKAWWDSLKA